MIWLAQCTWIPDLCIDVNNITQCVQELENAYKTAALTAQQLMIQGRENGCDLIINVSELENESLLSTVPTGKGIIAHSRGSLPSGRMLTSQASSCWAHPQQLPALGIKQGPVQNSGDKNTQEMEQELQSLKVCLPYNIMH